jgi:hypothetical protein
METKRKNSSNTIFTTLQYVRNDTMKGRNMTRRKEKRIKREGGRKGERNEYRTRDWKGIRRKKIKVIKERNTGLRIENMKEIIHIYFQQMFALVQIISGMATVPDTPKLPCWLICFMIKVTHSQQSTRDVLYKFWIDRRYMAQHCCLAAVSKHFSHIHHTTKVASTGSSD